MTPRFLCLPVLRCEACGDQMVMTLPMAVCCANCRRRAAYARYKAHMRQLRKAQAAAKESAQ